jgi:hypothetical protein
MPIFTESGLDFQLEADRTFRPEAEDNLARLQDVMHCDFVVMQKERPRPHVDLLEVKSSSPHPDNAPDLESFLQEVCQKFLNSLLVFLRCKGGVFDVKLPSAYEAVDALACDYRFLLIIKGHKPEWCLPLMDALNVRLRDIQKSFQLKQTRVANENDAVAFGVKLRSPSQEPR